MASPQKSLLPDVPFTHHSPTSTDRRYVESYGSLLTADGTSPTYVRSIATTPRSSFSETNGSDTDTLASSSIAGATFNLANGIVGAGIIGLPYAIHQGGFLFGVTIIAICCYLTHYTVTLMVETGRAHGRFSYEELCELAFGASGFYLLSLFQLFNSFGACIVYMLVISTTVPDVLSPYYTFPTWGILGNDSIVTIVTCTCVLLPLSLYRNMSHLEKWSFLSLCSVVVLCFGVVYTFVKEEHVSAYAMDNRTALLYDIHKDWAPSIGVIAFAFGCQQYSFFVFGTLKDPTRRRWWCVSALGTGVAFVASMVLGIFGYLRYGSNAMPNILNNMNAKDPFATVTRVVLALTMCFTFPLDFFVVRYTIQRALQRCCRDEWDDDTPYLSGGRGSGGGRNDGRSGGGGGNTLAFSPVFTRQHLRGKGHASDLSLCTHVVTTMVLWGVCLIVCVAAMKDGGLGLVLELTGSVGTIFTAFVFPSATFLKLGTNNAIRKWMVGGVDGLVYNWGCLVVVFFLKQNRDSDIFFVLLFQRS
jgi:amino acid permease